MRDRHLGTAFFVQVQYVCIVIKYLVPVALALVLVYKTA
jgi:hypothetical protein